MERLKEFNTISIKIPKKMMYRDRFGKWKAVPSMTGRGKISYRNGIPSIDIIALGDKVEIQDEGKNFEKKNSRKLSKKNNIDVNELNDEDDIKEPTRKRKRPSGGSLKKVQNIKYIRDVHRFLA